MRFWQRPQHQDAFTVNPCGLQQVHQADQGSDRRHVEALALTRSALVAPNRLWLCQ
jgi:hypothetical protein